MVVGYHRTPEAEKSWSERVPSIEYEDSPDDTAYKRFLEITKRTPQEKRKREILSLTRKVVGVGGKEFIVWNEREVAYDGIGNEIHFFRGSMGLIPMPVPMIKVRQIPDTLEAESYIDGIRETKTGYSVPFNTKNADMFYKDCVGASDDDLNRIPTHFIIEVGNTRFTVPDWESWRNSPAKDLIPQKIVPPRTPPQQVKA